MKRKTKNITNPDELNENLQYSSPATWIVLGLAVILLVGFFVWSCLYQITIKVSGAATIHAGQASLVVEKSSLQKLEVGQKVYIAGLEGEILSFDEGQPVVSSFSLEDGDYSYYVVIKKAKPVEFLLWK